MAFLDGDAVFCRNWPHMYGLVGVPEMSKIKPGQVGLSQLPTVALCKEVLHNARPRPRSPYYSEMSRMMAEHFNRVLAGATSPEGAVETLQSELQNIIEQGG